jgi:hypothetical protein
VLTKLLILFIVIAVVVVLVAGITRLIYYNWYNADIRAKQELDASRDELKQLLKEAKN